MLTTFEIIELIRARHGNCTDYRIAKLLDISQPSLHSYTVKRRSMSDEIAIKAARLLGFNEFYFLACIHAEQSKNNESRHLWQALAGQFEPTEYPHLMIQQKMAV